MRKRAFLLKSVTLALMLLLAARAYSSSVLPHQEYREGPNKGTFLRFEQALALADFDGDGRLDKATLAGTGRSKSLEIRLSHTKTSTLLRFDTLTSERGAVFSEDVDNDGDNDLVWTDLIHPDDVIVWLDDGAGRFERVCPDRYAREFVLTDAPAVDDPENPREDLAASPQRDSFASSSPAPRPSHPAGNKTYDSQWPHAPLADCCRRTCLERGPPSLL